MQISVTPEFMVPFPSEKLHVIHCVDYEVMRIGKHRMSTGVTMILIP